MPQPFIHRADVVNTIRNILEHYPLGDGPIREVLQNSDDAKATRQIFVLDHRSHPTSSLSSPSYAQLQQVPSLIAINNAHFDGRDWSSLQTIFDSSKVQDPNAVGQFGQGFRCVYHLTDCPQIFSGHKLALLDLPEGITLDMMNEEDASHTSHLAAFQGLPGISYSSRFPSSTVSQSTSSTFPPPPTTSNPPYVDGTIIRLPLRPPGSHKPSSPSRESYSPQQVLKLFDDFFKHDLECVLLFLKNIKQIAVYEINPQGEMRELSSAVLTEGKRSGSEGGDFVTWRCVVETRVSTFSPPVPPTSTLPATSIRPTGGTGAGSRGVGKSMTKTMITTWRMLSCPFADPPSLEVLKRIPEDCNAAEQMKWRKLDQSIRVAAPLSFVTPSSSSSAPTTASLTSTIGSSSATPADTSSTSAATFGVRSRRQGRLFHGLPLPRSNTLNWPIHVDAKFALPPSRQRIRSFNESGFIGEWNMRLFGAFIPQAWTFLLHVLARDDKVVDIFEYWPPPGGSAEFNAPVGIGFGPRTRSDTTGAASGTGTSSLAGRSQGMLETVFDLVVIAKAAVWPVYFPTFPQLPEFAELGNLKVALEVVHLLDLRSSLVECGIRFTKPPSHFKSLIENNKFHKFEILEPENVRKELLVNLSKLEQAVTSTPKHANSILEFLIRSGDIQLLIGLPLLRNVDGHYITLRKLALPGSTDARKQTLHTLLDARSAPLFKNVDSNAIALNDLPRSIVTALEEKGPGRVNVVKLDLEKVIEYLCSDPRWSSPSPPTSPTFTSGTSLTPPESTQWLGKFYSWLINQPYASGFFQNPEVKSLYIIPTQLGLMTVEDPVFDTMSATVLKCLRALGLGLLDPSIGSSARQFLVRTGDILRKDGDVKGILDGVNGDVLGGMSATGVASDLATMSLGLSCLEWKPLVEYLVRHTHIDQLSEEQRRKLRLLPIYPLLDPFDTTHTPRPGPIPDNKMVYGVTFVDLLPIIDSCVYLDLRGYSVRLHGILHLLSLGSPEEERPLTNNDLLDLGVRNFGSQPPGIRSSIVTYVVGHEKSVPRDVLERLWETAMIICRDGIVRKPGEVIDTSSTVGIGAILSSCTELTDGGDGAVFEDCLPRLQSTEDWEIMEGLKKLSSSPLRTVLDESLLVRLTEWISKNVDRPAAVEASRKLLKFLAANPGHGNFVGAIPMDHKWIPTDVGLKARHECRDRGTQSLLFDEVYALVEDGVQVTDVLKAALGWTEKLSHETLFDQLDATLKKGGECNKVREIIKVIGSEKVAPADLERLRVMLEGREWVPTTVPSLVKPEDAVLGHVVEGIGIFQVSFSEAVYPNVIAFLRYMGVRDKPTPEMILAKIEDVGQDSLTPEQVDRIVKLLECLPGNLEDDFRDRVLVPDTTGIMRPVADLHFNDTGSRQERLPLGVLSIAHPSVSEYLARTLDIKPLASTLSTFSQSGYIGESFITSVRKALTDHNETQMIPEMLANAADAKATRFVLVLDEMPSNSQNLISPNLEVFQQCPALLVYNDGEFTEDDLKGLCRTGEGSKANKRDSIGQFGRGALTMFHITEFPMLVSSTHALFIDPSQGHLRDLPQGANNQRMELRTLRNFYPNHLAFLGGLHTCFGLDSEDTSPFSGTLFRLPLRHMTHIQRGEPISQELWEARGIQERILSTFKEIAGSCLLFTDLECIQAYSRSQNGTLKELWSVRAGPGVREFDGDFSRRMVQILEDDEPVKLWQTISYHVRRDIPEFASELIEKMKLRNPMVELAAHIRPPGADHNDYHGKSALFSTIPLTEETCLPVHCSATFITTSDRRHIRLQLDNDSGNQAKYNAWLLEDVVPIVYFYLLEHLSNNVGVPNEHFWPSNDTVPVDKLVIPSLYGKHLRTSTRRLFKCAYGTQHHLTPQEVMILPEGSPVQPVIDFLEPLTVIKCGEPFLSRADDAELDQVCPPILRQLIRASRERLTQAFLPSPAGGDPVLSTEVLYKLLDFFIAEGPEHLIDLPLLPLEDSSTLGTFAPSLSQPTYYVWSNLTLPPDVILANPSRLVSLDFDARMLLDKGFNIAKLNSVSMASLMEESFPKQASIEATEEQRHFIYQFWNSFRLLELNKEDFLDFPLVPTLTGTPGRFISLNSCKYEKVLIVPITIDELICQSLSFFGVLLVRNSEPHCPPSLAQILESDFPKFNFRDILRSLKELDRTLLLARFQDFDIHGDREEFSEWARRILFQDVPSNLRGIACALPVWRSRNTNTYVSADQLVVLPNGLDEAVVAPYITRRHIATIPNEQSQILRAALENLGVSRLSYTHLLAAISEHLPPTMPTPARREEYKWLVTSILEHIPHGTNALNELRLPNASNFMLRPVRELFLRADPLFSVSLEAGDQNFASPEFEELESRLPFKKLTNIDMGIFTLCMESIAAKTGEERRNCGRIALEIFNVHLPVILANLGADAHQWDLIDEVNFIPKVTEPLWRHESETENDLEDVRLDVSQYVEREFGDLVAPRDILRQEYVSVAWSQRCLPVSPLSESLIRAFPAIGRPSVNDVIRHLRVLVNIADVHPNHLAILPDIIATYKFLDERADDSSQLSVLRDERLFLNVNQTGEDWEWEAAVNLSFDVRDVGDLKSVRRFLYKFKNLLVAAGAQEVNHPRIASVVDTDHNLGQDRTQRKFNDMRRRKTLVDVEFIPQDHDADRPLLGHRSFLAAASDHLMDIFCSGFRESREASADNPVHVPMAYSRDSVSLILEHIYGTAFESPSVSVLLEGTKLAEYWRMHDLVEIMKGHIIESVNPETIDDISRVAEEEGWTTLTGFCDEYRNNNPAYIERFRLSHGDA